MAETRLEFKIRLTLANGTPLPPAVAPGPVKNATPYYSCGLIQSPGTSIFKDIEMRLNDCLVSSMSGNYAINSYLQTLMFYNFETRNSALERQLYFDDNK